VPIENVHVYHGDTGNTPWALVGTGGSRAATMASGAVLHSTRQVKAKLLAIAAEMLEANPADLLIENGIIHPAGVPSVQLTVAEVAAKAYSEPTDLPDDLDFRLEVEGSHDGGLGSWSSGTHLCEVEIDLETGKVEIKRYLVVEDCGRMINPAIVEGQVRGGVAQGVGEVLFEWSAYDDDANYMASTFMDYLLPTASEIPKIDIIHLEKEPNEEVFFRGVGEGGLLVAPAAITNAIEVAKVIER
jgi:carbon-monoxide dehydrogenase large subunit